MEKGEGIELSKKWGITAFPTLIYLDEEGEEIHRKLGGGKPEHLIAAAKTALSGKGIGSLTDQFNKGNREDTFVSEYLFALKKARKTELMETVVSKVLNEQDKSKWTHKTNWQYFDRYFTNVYKDEAEYFLANREQYIKSVGKDAVNEKVMNLYKKDLFNVAVWNKQTRSRAINEEAYKKFENSLNKFNIEQKDLLLTHIQFTLAGTDMKKCIEIVENYVKNDRSVLGTYQMYEWSCLIRRKHFDKEVVAVSNKWFEMVIANTTSEELKNKCKDLMEGKAWNPYGMMPTPAMRPGAAKKQLKDKEVLN